MVLLRSPYDTDGSMSFNVITREHSSREEEEEEEEERRRKKKKEEERRTTVQKKGIDLCSMHESLSIISLLLPYPHEVTLRYSAGMQAPADTPGTTRGVAATSTTPHTTSHTWLIPPVRSDSTRHYIGQRALFPRHSR